MLPRLAPIAASGALLALSCQAVIGIEDITDQPRPGALGGSGGEGPVAAAGSGGQNDAGGTSAGTAGAPAMAGGASGGAGESGLAGSGGAAGAVGGPLGQAGSEGVPDPTIDEPEPDEPEPDEPEPDDIDVPPDPPGITVSGRVIDFFRRPVPGVPVSIADQTATTDADGRFSIGDVQTPYDALLSLSMTRDNTPARYAYVYEGLERNDPTLQVYSALVQRGGSSLAVAINQVDFSDPNRQVIVTFQSPDAHFADTALQSDGSALLGEPSWTGPATTTGTAHAMCVLRADGADGDPPVAYEAHQTQALIARDDEIAVASFDLPPALLPDTTITGSASGGSTGDRSHLVALRFPDGVALPLIGEASTTDGFDYLVPDLEETSLVVAAADGSSSIAPYAVAWQSGIAPGSEDVELDIPNPVLLSSPQDDTDITPSTPFVWSTANQTAQTFLFHLEFSASYQGILIVTSRNQVELPSFPDGFTVPAGTAAYWSVETHGDAASVDALAGPDGFLDSFAIGTPYPIGPTPSASSGYYTESARNTFTMGTD